MRIIKAIHVTATERKLLKAFEAAWKAGVYKPGEILSTQRMWIKPVEQQGDTFTLEVTKRTRDDLDRIRLDRSKIIISMEG